VVHCNHRLLEREGERRDSYDHQYASVATLEGLTLVGRVGRVERVWERRRRADIGLLRVDHYRG